ncbi:hypothetical protein BGZ65_007084 [Modicella reniformis]|uniref:Uncharacterized protein n=1 Tax=Modicella reniformis TaxID=1440133 RepID=A0A9P6SP81_9FUNG|nr:hypothetical protein BGZ65_007084 [Modicella reniformis]
MAALVLRDPIMQLAAESSSTAAIVDEAALASFIQRTSDHVGKNLPSYAVPRFLRICERELETTGTFKNMKVELRKEGFDLGKVKDRMYWWTPQGRYVPFGHTENDQILSGGARL